MKTATLLSILIFSTFSYAQKENNPVNGYRLEPDDDGIVVEVFDSLNTDENRFTKNNKIFRKGVSFHYRFEHIDKSNKKHFFKYVDTLGYWEFVPDEKSDKNTIKQVIISVKNGLQGFDRIPGYSQTIIGYGYPTEDNYMGSIRSASGVIENEANIWMHPPRDKYFEILELNPFPYIKAPYTIGTKWTWSLTIGDNWADGRWRIWKGKIQNEYEYKIIDFKPIQSDLGELECYIIDSQAESRIGVTRLKSYFNLKYGFVRLEYTNIDGSKTNIELTKYLDLSNTR